MENATGAWSAFWAQNEANACFGGQDLFLVKPLWVAFFSSQPKSTKILDLASGKGAVLQTASEVSKQSNLEFELMGVDSAKLLEQPSSEFHLKGDTRCEDLPFDENSFDVVVSQFGFEYSDVQKSVTQMAKVLKTGGQFCFILHADQGAVHQETNLRLQRLAGLPKLAEIVLKLAKLEARQGREKAVKTNIHQKLSLQAAQQFEACRSVLVGAEKDDAAAHLFQFLGQLWGQRSVYSPADVFQKSKQANLELQVYQKRLEAMLQAAMSQQDLSELVLCMNNSQLKCTIIEQVTDRGGNVVCWNLQGELGVG